MVSELKYSYKANVQTTGLGIAFFALCGFVLSYKARTNTRGLNIEDLIELSPNGATIFFWCLTAFSFLFVLGGSIAIYFSLTQPRFVVLTENELVVPPQGFNRKEYRLPLDKVFYLQELNINGQVMLKITFAGKTRTIVRSLFENKQKYEEVKQLLTSKRQSHSVI